MGDRRMPTWPAPTGGPLGAEGWYLGENGLRQRSVTPPQPGDWLASDGWWYPAAARTEPWERSRWGLGDVGWCALAYLVAGIVVGIAIGVAVGFDDFGPYALGAYVAANTVALGAVVWLATYRKGLGSLRHDFGLRARWRDLPIGLAMGVVGLIAANLVGYGVDRALGTDERSSNLPVDDLTSVGQFAVFGLAVAVLTPIVEELVFRGLLYRSLLKRGQSTPRAITITTGAFVLPHLFAAESWPETLSLAASIGVLGLAFNLACTWTGNRLAAPILAHALVNGVAAVALYLG